MNDEPAILADLHVTFRRLDPVCARDRERVDRRDAGCRGRSCERFDDGENRLRLPDDPAGQVPTPRRLDEAARDDHRHGLFRRSLAACKDDERFVTLVELIVVFDHGSVEHLPGVGHLLAVETVDDHGPR